MPTPSIGNQLAKAGWYEAPTGAPTTTDILRAREALARLQVGLGVTGWVNTASFEAEGLAGEHGPLAKAIWIALAKSLSVATPTEGDASVAEWVKGGAK